jgi:hypothetical protein
MRETCPYRILEVAEDCSDETIVAVYRHLVKIHHPDKGGSRERFQLIQDAYELLHDKQRRAKYDARVRAARSERTRREQETVISENPRRDSGEPTRPTRHYMSYANQGHKLWGKYPNSTPKPRKTEVRERPKLGHVGMLAAIFGGGLAAGLRWRSVEETKRSYQDVMDKFGLDLQLVELNHDILRWGLCGFIAAVAAIGFVKMVFKRNTKLNSAYMHTMAAVAAGLIVGQSATRGDSVWAVGAFSLVLCWFALRPRVNDAR